MMGGVYGMVCPYCGGAIGSFGPHICSTPPAPVVKMTDSERDDLIKERCDSWDEEDAITAFKYLKAKWDFVTGSSLNARQDKLRFQRHQAEKQA